MILTHESESQEDQFDEKNGGQKSRDTIPLITTDFRNKVKYNFVDITVHCKKKTLNTGVPTYKPKNRLLFHNNLLTDCKVE